MPLETAIRAWEGLKEISGDSASIHITGGEPFLCFDEMVTILEEGRRRGLGPVDQIETNAFWACSRDKIIDVLRQLDSLGMCVLKISCDPFHQEFISIEKVRTLAAVATEVLGSDRVLVRWEKYVQEPVEIEGLAWEDKAVHFLASLQQFPCRFTGRAADRLAGLAAVKTPLQLAEYNCSGAFLGAKGIHIDPYGNVFSGTCSGIIVGNLNTASLPEIWKRFDPPNTDFIGKLFNGGPASLVEDARRIGFQQGHRYAGKCHLCSDIRKFFFDKGLSVGIIGPAPCYSEGKDASRQISEFGVQQSG